MLMPYVQQITWSLSQKNLSAVSFNRWLPFY